VWRFWDLAVALTHWIRVDFARSRVVPANSARRGPPLGWGTDTLLLPNCDFDSGKTTKPAEYALTDDTYAKLLARLSERKFDLTSPELRANILDFYSDLSAPIDTKKGSG
jgi:hypothetical protein